MSKPCGCAAADLAAAARLDLGCFPCAHGIPLGRAVLKTTPEDFQVSENLGYLPSGEGGHAWLRVRKRDANTEWVAKRLAEFSGVAPVSVGYAGLKDRNALTTQWFSVDLLGRAEPDWDAFDLPGVEILEARRNPRKLRRGALAGNSFTITLHAVDACAARLDERCARIAAYGVPAYFGPQRFGRGGGNLERARELLVEGRRVRNRHLRGLYLSAARAWLFNRILALRIGDGTWNQPLEGDLMMLDGSHSLFRLDAPDERIKERSAELDIHPSGTLWGRGGDDLAGEPAAVEARALDGLEAWQTGLEAAGLRRARRALRTRVHELRWEQRSDGRLSLRFGLPAGAYATVLLRELLELRDGG